MKSKKSRAILIEKYRIMKKNIQYIIVALLSCCFAFSCSDWTDVEAEKIDKPGKSDAYYADLRAWKATHNNREISFGWFGGWTGVGASMVSSLAGLPDSLDLATIWGEWKNLNEEKIRDMKYVQEVKGTVVMATVMLNDLGSGFTPSDVDFNQYWGWEGDLRPDDKEVDVSPAQEEAIRKYAKAICDEADRNGYQGIDIDHEPNVGGGTKPYSIGGFPKRMKIFVEEIGKYYGPKSGTGKLFAIDGEYYSNMLPETGQYFDYFISQAYDSWGVGDLNSRLNMLFTTYPDMDKKDLAKRFIVTENFEKATYYTNGGADFWREDGSVTKSYEGMAEWQPLVDGVRYVKGGAGVYHIEYEYSVPGKEGFYPYTRNAIRIMSANNK